MKTHLILVAIASLTLRGCHHSATNALETEAKTPMCQAVEGGGMYIYDNSSLTGRYGLEAFKELETETHT